MSADVTSLIAEMSRAVLDQPLTGRWQKDHSPERGKWFGGTSNNLPRMAEAALASLRPLEAAAWWKKLLTDEWGPPSPPGWWDVEEPGVSRNYGHATLLSEAASLVILRRELPGHPVLPLLERSLRRRAALCALCAVPQVIAHGGRNPPQMIYSGLGVLGTGGRSNPIHWANHPLDHVFHRMLWGTRPGVELQAKEAERLADLVMARDGFGLTDAERDALRKLVASNGTDMDSVRQAVAMLGPARIVAGWWVRRYQDGTIACAIERCPGRNTSQTYLVAAQRKAVIALDRGDVAWLHPYGGPARVRGGTPLGAALLGDGHVWWEDDGRTFACANLTPAELAQGPHRRRHELRHHLPDPATVVWEVRMGPDHAPRLTVGGATVTVTPPPAPAPKQPAGPSPPPPPKKEPPVPTKPGPQPKPNPAGPVVLGPKGTRIRLPQPEERVAILNILPGDGRSGRWESLRIEAASLGGKKP
jgi:hypothetical protein